MSSARLFLVTAHTVKIMVSIFLSGIQEGGIKQKEKKSWRIPLKADKLITAVSECVSICVRQSVTDWKRRQLKLQCRFFVIWLLNGSATFMVGYYEQEKLGFI